MAATNDTSLPERNKGWYQEDLTEVNEPIRKLLESYSRVPSAEVVKHVNQIVSIHGQWDESRCSNLMHAFGTNCLS